MLCYQIAPDKKEGVLPCFFFTVDKAVHGVF